LRPFHLPLAGGRVNGAGDSIAAIVLRLLARVGALERVTEQQARRLDKLAKAPKPVRRHTHDAAPSRKTGVDPHGAPEWIDVKPAPRPPGRPAGSRDVEPRVRRFARRAPDPQLLDADWDKMDG